MRVQNDPVCHSCGSDVSADHRLLLRQDRKDCFQIRQVKPCIIVGNDEPLGLLARVALKD